MPPEQASGGFLEPLLVSGGDLRRPLSCVGNGIDRDVALSTLDSELFNYCGRKRGLGKHSKGKERLFLPFVKLYWVQRHTMKYPVQNSRTAPVALH